MQFPQSDTVHLTNTNEYVFFQLKHSKKFCLKHSRSTVLISAHKVKLHLACGCIVRTSQLRSKKKENDLASSSSLKLN